MKEQMQATSGRTKHACRAIMHSSSSTVEDEKWQAIVSNDAKYDGIFYYGVKTTGIFCRPSCKSKQPLRQNVEYFDTSRDAIRAGYRPCKRCRPDLIDYQPVQELAEKIKETIDVLFSDSEALSHELVEMGVSRRHMTEIFVNRFGKTPGEYVHALRLEAAKTQLAEGKQAILDIAYALGFESASSFYAFFRNRTGMSPGEYRKYCGVLAAENVSGDAHYYTYDSPFGKLAIAAESSDITAVQFADVLEGRGPRKGDRFTDLAARQLEEYFSGKRTSFELPLHPIGTPFRRSVWTSLGTIPYGETRSYKDVARLIGNPGASRAVGMALNKNPLLIVVPCHRVTGSDGSLTGYAASLDIKKRLLEFEQAHK